VLDENVILDRLNQIFENVLDLDSVNLTRGTRAPDVPGWDSIAHVQLMIAVEKTFGFRLRSVEMAGLKNVGDLVDHISARATR
jgi:acyl carrier protein